MLFLLLPNIGLISIQWLSITHILWDVLLPQDIKKM